MLRVQAYGMKLASAFVIVSLAFLFAAPAAMAAPEPGSPLSIVPAASFTPSTTARLDRSTQPPTWQQLKQPMPKRQPTVGQYSCTPCCDPCWRWTLSIPIWIPGIDASSADGDVSVGGDRDIFDDGSEALGELEFAFVGAVFVRKGRWGGGVDFLTATIDASADFTIGDGAIQGDADGKLEATIARARIDYLYARSMAPWKLGRCGCAEHRVYLGARAYDVSMAVASLTNPDLALDVSDTWVDPILGLESRIPFARNWSFLIAGDVGGWSIDGNWSWNVLGAVHWHFANRWALTLGYNVLDLRREFVENSRNKKIDLNLAGPQIAINFYI